MSPAERSLGVSKALLFFLLSLLFILHVLWDRCSAEKGFISMELKIVLQHMHKKKSKIKLPT